LSRRLDQPLALSLNNARTEAWSLRNRSPRCKCRWSTDKAQRGAAIAPRLAARPQTAHAGRLFTPGAV